ncbi:MAG: MATE family efflux transporter [Halobacteriaceae archaeon]
MGRSLLARVVARLRNGAGAVFKRREEFDLTSGNIRWPLFYLSLPIVVTNLLQTAYNLVDTIWLGQYSTEALAAISFAFPLVFFLISLGLGLAIGGSILVAQHTGADEESTAEYAAAQTVTFSLLAAVVLGGVGYVVVEDILRLLGASPAVLPRATAYLEIVSLGMVFLFAFFVFMSLMRGYGDTITPMLVMFVTVVVNMVLDPILIFGWGPAPELGVAGAAYATVASRALATAIGLGIMFRGLRGIEIHLDQLWPDPEYLLTLLRVAAPASVESTGNAVAINLMLVIVGTFPTVVVAAYGVGVRVLSVIFLPAIAVGRGVETMAGQNIGADQTDRAAATSHFAARAMFLLLGAVGVVVWVGADGVIRVFTDDPPVIETGRLFLRYVAPTFGFTGVFNVYKGGFRGAGRTLTAAIISITMLGLIRLPVAWFTSRPLGHEGIWLAFAVSNVLGAAIATGWYLRGTWRDADLTEETSARVAAPDEAGERDA